jgi:hypothetical protein
MLPTVFVQAALAAHLETPATGVTLARVLVAAAWVRATPGYALALVPVVVALAEDWAAGAVGWARKPLRPNGHAAPASAAGPSAETTPVPLALVAHLVQHPGDHGAEDDHTVLLVRAAGPALLRALCTGPPVPAAVALTTWLQRMLDMLQSPPRRAWVPRPAPVRSATPEDAGGSSSSSSSSSMHAHPSSNSRGADKDADTASHLRQALVQGVADGRLSWPAIACGMVASGPLGACHIFIEVTARGPCARQHKCVLNVRVCMCDQMVLQAATRGDAAHIGKTGREPSPCSIPRVPDSVCA